MVTEPEGSIVPLARPIRHDIPDARIAAVLIHGFSGSPFQMRDIGEFLTDNGIATFIIRLPGHGSRLEYFAASRLEDWMEVIHNAVESLKGNYHNVVIIGRSLGGALALIEANEYPDSISALVLIATPAPTLTQRVQDALLPIVGVFKKRIKKMWAKPEENEERTRQGRYLEIPLSSLHQFFRTMKKVRELRMAAMRTPTMLVQGMRDEQAKPKSAAWYENRLGVVVKDIVLIANASHDATSVHADAAMRRRLLDFLKQSCA